MELRGCINKIMESAGNGQTSILFDSIKFDVLISLEKLGFNVEWFNKGDEKGWLVKW